MPYLHLDLPGTYPVEVKRELATRLCMLYALVMETPRWRPNVGIAELGRDNLYHLGADGLDSAIHLVYGDDGRLADDNATPAGEDAGVGGAEVNGEIGGEMGEEGCKHARREGKLGAAGLWDRAGRNTE